MSYPVILLGAGGHAKVLLDTLLEQNVKIIGVTVPNPEKDSKYFCEIPVIGNDDVVKNFDCKEIELVNGIGSVGSTDLRRKVYEKFKSWGYRFRNVIHSGAIISCNSEVLLGEGIQVMAGAVVNVGAVIGENSIINTRASIDHDCQIGKHVHIAPGTTLSGNVKVGEGSHIGVGTTIIQGVAVGSKTIIGAGSLVLHDIDDGVLAYGVPAVVKKYIRG